MKSSDLVLLIGLSMAGSAQAGGEQLLEEYRAGGAGPFDAAKGEAFWMREHADPEGGPARSCGSCHGADPVREGKHVKTGKPIEPIALSANPQRLADAKKTEKWFRRNCRWTLGRVCTPQEKGNVVRYLSGQ